MGCDCGKPKCDGHCGVSPAVLEINNPSECVLFHRVEVPASMGDSTTNPPKSGAYKNVLLYYEADQTSWLYSSDGIPQKLVNGLTDYEDAINLPQINGVTLLGNKSLADIGVTDAINNALQPYTPSSELAEVAFSGSYADLTDKPTVMTGATPSAAGTSGFVPAPAAGDEDKALKGDGTWGVVGDVVELFVDSSPGNLSTPFKIYKNSDDSNPITHSEMRELFTPSNKKTVVLHETTSYDGVYPVIGFCYDTTEFYIFDAVYNSTYYIAGAPGAGNTDFSIDRTDLQEKLTAGSNIVISGDTISATVPTPTVLNVTYDTTATTWTATDVGITLRETPSGTFPAILERIQTFAVPTPVFTNASTGSTLDAEGLYNLLETGADVVLNGVPISVRYEWINGTTTFTVGSAVCNGVKLTEVGPYHAERLDPDTSELVFSVDQFSYSATVSASADGSPDPRFLPFAIRVYKRVTFNAEVSPDPQTEYAFEVQGISYSRMNSPT